MNSLWQAPAIVVAIITWLAAPPATLGEAAQREAIRRHFSRHAVATLSNLGMPVEIVPASNQPAAGAVGTPATALPSQPANPAQAGAAADPAMAGEPRKDEKWWRDRIAASRSALERDGVLAEAMQSRINSLQADAISRDDPAQQLQLRQQLGRALGELERLKKQVEADRKAITDVQNEARRQGVPPGWVR